MITAEYIYVPEEALKTYAKSAGKNIHSKTATEMSYYADFKKFLEEIFPPSKGYLVQIESKLSKTKNKPDFTISYNNLILFHIEAKLPNTQVKNLIQEKKENRLKNQIYRYREEGVQLLITDFLNVWLVDPQVPNNDQSEQKFKFECKLIEEKGSKYYPVQDATGQFQALLALTCADYLETISNVKTLITPLSQIALSLRKKVLELLNFNNKVESPTKSISNAYLKRILDDFKKSIFKEETENIDTLFSDLYAQTIVYGAFSAWIKFCQKGNHYSEFSLANVGEYLPFGSFLRDLFLDLKNKTPREFKNIINEMESRFQNTEYKKVMSNTETLITTFYSEFLQLYDPITAKERGVVYTPHEIVEFMIHGIDFILKRWLDKNDGIISPKRESLDLTYKNSHSKHTKMTQPKQSSQIERLQILDPAAGTNAFACGLLHVAKEKFLEKFNGNKTLAQSAFDDWVKNEFFNNMYAFEILMAPYVLGNIRTFLTLDELGLKLNAEEYQLNTFLMNTLMSPPEQTMDAWIFNNQDIGREIKKALQIRDHRDIFVIMGNPPYNLSSQNNCEWINNKINDYKENLHEKNLKILSDDYVKFIRFAQWKIEQVGRGIVALITNNRYLEGQMFSVMRPALRNSFDHIYIVNLHGDMRKKESGNPFDIRVGVAIAFMVRIDNSPNKKAAIHYMDIPQESREEKFAILGDGFQENQFKLLSDTTKNYFIGMDTSLMDHYEAFIPIDRLFKCTPTSGIMVGKDHLLVDTDSVNVKSNLTLFFNQQYDELDALKIKTHDSKSWSKAKVFEKTTLENSLKSIIKLQYRGFDFRYLAYDPNIVEGHRMGYIDQISPNNPAITVSKSSRKPYFCTAFISKNPIEKCYLSITDTSYAFLLKKDGKYNIKIPNLPFTATEEDIFYYIYAILFSETYRTRYDEYLRKSFPGIPFTIKKELFMEMSGLGKQLADCHLLNCEINPKLELAEVDLDKWIIEDYYYDEINESLFLSKVTIKNFEEYPQNIPYIKGISKEMWAFSVGSIPQIDQFLRSRVYSRTQKWNTLQRPINHEELIFLLKICSSIDITLKLLPQIDSIFKLIDKIEEF